MMEDIDQTASKQLWAEEADEQLRYGSGFHWVESPVISEYMNRQISGDPSVNWVQYAAAKYLQSRRAPRILSLGCGGGALERDLLRLKPDSVITAMDFSSGAIDTAVRHARDAGLEIDYRIADLNVIRLEPETYDFVFASGALHHLSQLEDALAQVSLSLQPGGMLIANEYVGPNQLQWTPRQVATINEILALLPDRYRRRISNRSDYKREFLGPSPVSEMNRNDPTEAVRSEEIIPLVRRRFHLLELKPFGGTILHMLLQDIVGNFNPATETDTCILKLICYIERQLVSAEFLTSDFTFFVAERAEARR
jgi:SAM-dependent methyltransferase